MAYLESHAENIVLIGIEPKILSGKISSSVKKSGDKLADLIKNKKLESIEILS
jgi:uncharacterized Rossmann fold enzyme